jgi:putative transposase
MSILPKEPWFREHSIKGIACPVYGFWNSIHTDGGKENVNNLTASICQQYGMTHFIRPARKAKWGGHIERFLGTVAQRLKEVLGASFSDPGERDDYPSEALARMTIEEARDWLATYLWGEYHNSYHSGIGMTPMEKYAEGLLMRERQIGGGAPRYCSNPARLRRDVLPLKLVTVQDYGVRYNNLTYYDPAIEYWRFNPHPQKKKFEVRQNPNNVNFLLFYDPIEKKDIRIPLRREVPRAYGEQDMTEAREYCRSQGWDISEDAIFRARSRLDEIEKTAVAATKKEIRAKSARLEEQKSRQREASRSDTHPVAKGDLPPTEVRVVVDTDPAAVSADMLISNGKRSKVVKLRRPNVDLSSIKLL